MQKCATTLSPEISVEFAVQVMSQLGTGYILILEQDKLVGIFTERDLVKAIASGNNLSLTTLSDVMTHNVITIKESELGDLFSIIRLLHQRQISYLPVLDDHGQILGVITLQSIQQALPQEIDRYEQLAQTQQKSQAQIDKILSNTSTIVSKIRLRSPQQFESEYISPSCQNILGYSPNEFLADPTFWSSRLLPEDRTLYFQYLQDAVEQTLTVEYRCHHKDGLICWISDTFSAEWEETTQSWLVMSVKTDITKRKYTEEAWRESEERLQLALEASGDGLWDWKIPKGEVYLSPRWYEMLGYAVGELTSELSTWQKLIHPEDEPWVMDVLQSHLKDSSVPYTFEYRMQTKSGDWKWIANHGKVVARDTNGQPLRMIGIHRDINDHKLAEQALRERKAFLRTIGDRIPNGYIYQMIRELDGSNRFYYISAGVERTNGVKAEAILADSSLLFNNVVPEDIPYILQKQEESVKTMSVFDIQLREYSPEGDIRWVRLCSTPRRLDDGRMCWEGIRLDITDIKYTEETLRKSQALLTEAQHIAKIGNWEFDIATQNITWTEELFHISHRDPALREPSYEENLQLYHPEDAEKLHKAVERAITTGESYKLILRLNTQPEGSIRYIEGIGHTQFNTDGQVIRLYGTAQDITERFLAEKALQEKEKFLRSIYNGVEQCIFVIDILEDDDFRFVGLNPMAERFSGMRSVDTQGKTLEELFPPEMASSVRQHYQACVTARETITYEECLPFKGQDTWWITSLNPLFDEHSRVYRLVGSSIEISDRKRAEEKLRQAELRYRTLVEQIPGIFYTAPITATTEFAYISPQIYQFLNIPAQEWTAGHLNTWAKYVHPDDRDRITESVQNAIQAGESLITEYRMFTGDGRIIWVRDQSSLVLAPDGKTQILQGLAFDISDRKRLELALQASEKRLQNILSTASASIFSFRVSANQEWEYEYQSTASEVIFGYSPEEILADKMLWLSRVFLEDRDKVINSRFQRSITEGTSSVQYRFRHKDGSLRWISTTYSSHHQEETNSWIVIGVSIDISDRKQMEDALRLSEQNLREAQRVAHIGSWEWDFTTNTRTWSEELFRIQGIDPSQPVPETDTIAQRIHPDDWELYQQRINEPAQAGLPFEADLRMVRPNGEVRYVEIRGEPIFNNQGELIRIVGTTLDISDRKRVEEALRESETLFRTLSESAPIGIFRSDIHGINIYTNPRFQGICGLSIEESFGDRWMQFIHPDDLAIFLPQWRLLAANNQEFCTEVRYILPDSTLHFCRIKIVPILAGQNELMGYVGTIEDITESRIIEKMKNEFISIVSHELRTPLASIRGALGLLAAGVLKAQPETAQQMLEIAYNDTERLVRLVNDILDLEHLESNKFNLVKQWCDAATLIRRSVEAVNALANENNISLVMLLSSVQIWVDPDRIIQTLVNLIGNAIKFSPTNSTVAVSVEDGSDRVLFKVQDQGRGIPDNKLESIFGRFHQVDASDSRQKGGTGLGLAICRGIIQQHGGTIWAKSVLGEGSIFYFTIPKILES
nr:PAS domain-containing protein [Aulosira sp. ZfuVER01]